MTTGKCGVKQNSEEEGERTTGLVKNKQNLRKVRTIVMSRIQKTTDVVLQVDLEDSQMVCGKKPGIAEDQVWTEHGGNKLDSAYLEVITR